MGFWSTMAPIATVGSAFIPGVGPAVSMGIGAAAGAMAARERNSEMSAKAQQSRNAAADAIGVSYGRKDGKGSIPSIFDFNESQSSNEMAGVLGGAMQGMEANKAVGGQDFFSSQGQPGLYGGNPSLGAAGANQGIEGMKYADAGGPDWMKMGGSPQAGMNPSLMGGAQLPGMGPNLGVDYMSLGKNYMKPRM